MCIRDSILSIARDVGTAPEEHVPRQRRRRRGDGRVAPASRGVLRGRRLGAPAVRARRVRAGRGPRALAPAHGGQRA
eukprot:320497-Alexandrium_andersonii.AAC.1